MRALRMAAVAAVAVTGFTVSAQAAHALGPSAEVTTVVASGTGIGPQNSGHPVLRCPGPTPYAVSAGYEVSVPFPEDYRFADIQNVYIWDDGKTFQVDFRNTQTWADAAKMKRDVTVSVKLTMTCSNVNHGKPTGYDSGSRSDLPPGGQRTVTVRCPASHPWALAFHMVGSANVVVRDHTQDQHGATGTLYNGDPNAKGWGTISVTCGV